MKKRTALVVIFAVAVHSAFALDIVASTSWTAAFALTAGADTVSVLAPYEVSHPPEYVLRPSDIVTLSGAEVVIYAGYELMVERLLESVATDSVLLPIATLHNYQTIEAGVLAIAEALGTTESAEANLARIRSYLASWREELNRSLPESHVAAVHVHQRALAVELGLNVAATFGPGPLSARQIDEISKLDPVLVVDNIHNPIATPLGETTEAVIVAWRNFPGADGARTLLDLLVANREVTPVEFSER